MNYFAFNWLQVDKKDSSNGVELMRKIDEVFKESPSTWPHFAKLHEIAGNFKANVYNELGFESIDGKSSN